MDNTRNPTPNELLNTLLSVFDFGDMYVVPCLQHPSCVFTTIAVQFNSIFSYSNYSSTIYIYIYIYICIINIFLSLIFQ